MPHEGYGRRPELVEPEEAEVALDDDQMVRAGDAVQVVEHEALAEALGELVAQLVLGDFVPEPPAGIGDELALRVVNRDAQPRFHDAPRGFRADAETEGLDDRPREPALREVGMLALELERKAQRRVDCRRLRKAL